MSQPTPAEWIHPAVQLTRDVIAALEAVRDPQPVIVEQVARLRDELLPDVEYLATLDPRDGRKPG